MTPVLKQTRTPLPWDTGLWAAGCMDLEVEGGIGVCMPDAAERARRGEEKRVGPPPGSCVRTRGQGGALDELG